VKLEGITTSKVFTSHTLWVLEERAGGVVTHRGVIVLELFDENRDGVQLVRHLAVR
jgi:hypothetical protein